MEEQKETETLTPSYFSEIVLQQAKIRGELQGGTL